MHWVALMACWLPALIAGVFIGTLLGVLVLSIMTMGKG
jgi:hypothetical protein